MSPYPAYTDYEFFNEALPDYSEEYAGSSYKLSVLFNHIHVSYYLDDVEVYSTKFYTACLTESDVVSNFLDQLQDDVETALQAEVMKRWLATATPEPEPAELMYVVNVQPILDAAPSVPGLVKSHDPQANLGDENTIVDYCLSDGFPVSEYQFTPKELQAIFSGTYDPTEDDEYESFIEAMEAGLEHLADLGMIKKVQA